MAGYNSSTTHNAIDNYLQKISMDARKKIIHDNFIKAKVNVKELYKMYYNIMCSMHYSDEYNYTTCVWSILYSFPNIVTKSNASMVNDVTVRMRGVMNKAITAHKMRIIEKISKEAFCELIQYTGVNMVITNIKDNSINELEIYDMINDDTPVVFAMKLSHKTAIVCCIDDVCAKELCSKYNNCTLTMTSPDNSNSTDTVIRSRINTIYIKTQVTRHTESYDWNTKGTNTMYVNSALNYQYPIDAIMENSNMMKERQ